MKLSIIIVNYNTYKLTKQTIESVFNAKPSFKYEIILVDNASSDDSISKLQEWLKQHPDKEKVEIIINHDNLGFSKANNIGIKKANGAYILLLNSDTYIVKDCLERCISYIENHRRIGALGCKVILPNGSLDHACKRGFPTPKASLHYFLKLHKINPKKYGAYEALHLGVDEVGEVDVIMGAFMLMSKTVLDEVGLLDERFFMYGEDIDLCFRIKQAGYPIIYYPKASIIHYKGGSSKKKRTKIIYDFHNAMWLFYKKHYYKKYHIGISLLVFIGVWAKYALESAKNFLKHS